MSEPCPIELNPSSPPAVQPSDSAMVSGQAEAASVPPIDSVLTQAAKPEDVSALDEPPESWLWINKLDQMVVSVFAAVFLVLVGYHWATLGGWGMQPIEIDRQPERQYDFRIDINSASWVEWTQIEGIGETTANKIVSDRDSNGPFRTINDLLRVKGIGPKTLEKMRPFLRDPIEPPHDSRVEP